MGRVCSRDGEEPCNASALVVLRELDSSAEDEIEQPRQSALRLNLTGHV